jgi:hypothetical protein
MIRLYVKREPIPDNSEFPRIRPQLRSYEFPEYAIQWSGFSERVKHIRNDIRQGLEHGQLVRYRAPWTSNKEVAPNSLDLIFSQAVLEYVDSLHETYKAMSMWARPGAYASHVVDLSASYLSPICNGHWAYSDWEWRLARGRREVFLNRMPLTTHLACAADSGFDVLMLQKEYVHSSLDVTDLSSRFRALDSEDLRTRGVMLVLRKQRNGQSS